MIQLISEKPSASSLCKVIVTRYLKYAPVFAVMVLIDICLPYFYTGPLVQDLSYLTSKKCSHNGWKNVFMVHNFQNIYDIVSLNVLHRSKSFYIGV